MPRAWDCNGLFLDAWNQSHRRQELLFVGADEAGHQRMHVVLQLDRDLESIPDLHLIFSQALLRLLQFLHSCRYALHEAERLEVLLSLALRVLLHLVLHSI